MNRKVLIILAALIGCFFTQSICIAADKLVVTDPLNLYWSTWGEVAQEYELDPYLLYAIALKETGKYSAQRQSVTPRPYIITGHGMTTVRRKHDDAVKRLKERLSQGHDNLNIGVMQINTVWQKNKFSSPEELLDFKTNIRIGAKIIKQLLASPEPLVIKIGHYSSWNKEKAKKYGEHVLWIMDNLKKLSKRAIK